MNSGMPEPHIQPVGYDTEEHIHAKLRHMLALLDDVVDSGEPPDEDTIEEVIAFRNELGRLDAAATMRFLDAINSYDRLHPQE
jgi:hypothetical protein